jgi:hypothetical protein
MAQDMNNNPWVFDAVGQVGPSAVVGSIRSVTDAAAGDVVVLDEAGGVEVYRANAQATDTEEELSPGCTFIVDGIYISELPAGGKVYVYYA